MSDSVSTKWDPRFRRNLIALGVIVVISALVGGGYAPLVGGTTGESLSQKDILVFGAHGMLVGLFFSTFELFYVQGSPGQWLRRMPFAKALLARSVLNTVVIVSAFVIGGLTMVPERFTDAGAMESFLRDVAFSFVIALTFQFILTVRQVIGGRVLWNLILGRYHRPVKEDRIFMFLDMVGSMVVADKMGDLGAQSMITRFFFDVAQVTTAYGGETHRYVGDEVVVTWPTKQGIKDADCIRCCLGIRERISQKADEYQAMFGAVPDFRIGLHAGSVVAAECGDDKHEIVYFGDTINTAARIEQYCKVAEKNFLVSGHLVEMLPENSGIEFSHVTNVTLKGHETETSLYTAG